MQHLWIFYSLAWLLALWLWDWFKQLVLAKWGKKEIFLFWCFVFYCSFIGLNSFFQGSSDFSAELVMSGFIIGTLNFGIPICVLAAFQYLDRSFALVTLRITSSFLVLAIWIFVLGDMLSWWNIFWFFLGAAAIFLLSGYTFWKWITLHPKWILGLFIAIVCIVLSNSYFKYIVGDINIHNFMLIQFFVSFLWILLYMILRKKFVHLTREQTKIVFPYAFYSALVFVPQFLVFLPNIYLLGPLSLGYKMLSYSLIVPIILSVIFLWEPINKTRLFAFWLTVISIFLFLV